MIRIGSHCKMSSPNYLLGAVEETLANNANALMIYTGAPQNTVRKDISELKIEEAKQLMVANNIDRNDLVIHAPYLINLANTTNEVTFNNSITFLKNEIDRTRAIGANVIVLHPGSHVGQGVDVGVKKIAQGLDEVLEGNDDVYIALETMAGKGSEIGRSFEEIAAIIGSVKNNKMLKVCLDTCHINDAGYDLNNFDQILDEFDRIIGLDRLRVIHLNDSKNVRGAGKDRHENIGYGTLGFEQILSVVYNERINHLPIILETPYLNDNSPYKIEIEMIRNKTLLDKEEFEKSIAIR